VDYILFSAVFFTNPSGEKWIEEFTGEYLVLEAVIHKNLGIGEPAAF
jgi:hypothetical protein